MSIVDSLKHGLRHSLSDPKIRNLYINQCNHNVFTLWFTSFYFRTISKYCTCNGSYYATTSHSIFTIIPQNNFILSIILVIIAIVLIICIGGYTYKIIECAIKKKRNSQNSMM